MEGHRTPGMIPAYDQLRIDRALKQPEIDEARPTAIDLFAGCGGATLGFRRAGFSVLSAVEVDEMAASTYASNHPEVSLIQDDIRAITPERLLREGGVAAGAVTVIVGCPPCQGFSSHRLQRRARKDPRNQLVLDFARIVIEIRPPFFVFENVPGLLSRGVAMWDEIKKKLEVAEYRMAEGILDGADYGLPQHRKRFIAIGCRIASWPLSLPSETHRSPAGSGTLAQWKTVRDTISDLAPLDSGEHSQTDSLHYASHHTPRSLERFAGIPPDGGSRSDLDASLQLNCHQQHNGHYDVYGRLRWDRPAGTITGGCTQPSKGRFLHPEQNRGITLREAARLQGFPDDYTFEGAKMAVALQIGNAMPPPLAYHVAQSIQARQCELEPELATRTVEQ